MEEKRKDAGNQLTASSDAADTVTPTKLLEEAPDAEPPSSRRRGGQKRKACNINGGNALAPKTTSSKRQAREKPSASETEAVVPSGTGGRETLRPAEEAGREEAWEALEAKIEAEYAAIRSSDSNAHAVPIPIGESKRNLLNPSHVPVVPRSNVMTPAAPSGLFPESALAEELLRSDGPAVEYHCNSCLADCSRERYHCQKQADLDLCTECFNNGKFDSDMLPTDFIIMEPAEAAGVSGRKWTDQETLLLEALELLYKENWNEIAEHVATKTKAQCILHFIQMPIEDTFMDCDDEIDASIKENAEPTTANNDSSAPKGEPETTESRIGADENQPESVPVEISKPDDASELKVGEETNENCALKALKEAFEAVGSFPTPGGRFSFAESGNPVMALAAFLVRLVEPNAVTALIRSSLQSISGTSSSIDVAEMVEKDAQKNETKNEENQIKENSNSSAQVMGTREEEGLISSNKSDNPDLSKDIATRDAKELDDVTPKAEIHQNSAKEPSDKTLDESDKPDLPIYTAERSAKESEDKKPKEEISSTSAEGPGDRTSEEGTSHTAEAAKNAVVDPDSLPSEKKEPEQLSTSNSIAGSEINTGKEETKDGNNQTEDHHNIDNMKRAAVTALSAAAVKAKLLANQEEDQIRQLATLLIQKTAFFAEMESVVMKIREQMERSKQRLYQERAQIIASRLAFSAPSSRPMQQSLPINRVTMGFSNLAAKPPMGMTSQRPPISRSSMMVGPPPSNTFAPATSAGNPVRPTNQDKIPFATK
ncbi:DNA-binding family protein [Actinidia rufa]|uniref:DNA-binding family protein n=1 Tax=Actinidia rufa TaxID=165716 RepID=A0A7J0DZV0_9ERIC|nr:DNA-binding family protein [Actinidia rufa]